MPHLLSVSVSLSLCFPLSLSLSLSLPLSPSLSLSLSLSPPLSLSIARARRAQSLSACFRPDSLGCHRSPTNERNEQKATIKGFCSSHNNPDSVPEVQCSVGTLRSKTPPFPTTTCNPLPVTTKGIN